MVKKLARRTRRTYTAAFKDRVALVALREDKALLKRAKVIAAKNDTSINALFNAELRYLVETFDAAEKSGNQNYKSLLDFSLGNADEVTTLGKLGIDQTEDLFLLMAQARLPMPRLPDAVTQGMLEKLHLLPAASADTK